MMANTFNKIWDEAEMRWLAEIVKITATMEREEDTKEGKTLTRMEKYAIRLSRDDEWYF